jgi:translation elongation factor EF-Ts
MLQALPVHAGDFDKAVKKTIEKGGQDAGKAIEKGARDGGKAIEKSGPAIEGPIPFDPCRGRPRPCD